MQIKSHQSLSELTTFHIGGPASFYAEVSDEKDLQQALELAREKNLRIFVLGRGSNILVADDGFPGLVIHNKIKHLEIADSGLVKVGAGEEWDGVVAACVDQNLAGIECLSGVPGSTGGAVVQNIGAYGQTISDRIKSIRTIESASGQVKEFTPAESEFEYRNSRFKRNPGQYIVVSVELQLEPGGKPTVSYPHVQKHFQGKAEPTLAQLRAFIIALRDSKGYLIMPGHNSYNTAGSFFKNPIIGSEQFERLKSMLGEPGLNRFWETPNGVKIAAAYLMQEAGFTKGYREGNAGISPKHALSLVNFGGAKAAEIQALAEKIKNVVFVKFGVHLEEEVLYIS